MSQYLRFVLGRANVSDPSRITIQPSAHPWATQQLLDEFAAVFPKAAIKLQEGAVEPADLYVFPHHGPLDLRDRATWPVYHRLAKQRHAWVVLYGVDYRQVAVLPATAAFRYVLLRSLSAWLAEWNRIPLAIVRKALRTLRS